MEKSKLRRTQPRKETDIKQEHLNNKLFRPVLSLIRVYLISYLLISYQSFLKGMCRCANYYDLWHNLYLY